MNAAERIAELETENARLREAIESAKAELVGWIADEYLDNGAVECACEILGIALEGAKP
jgi:hypothetical protein